jgi:hypothetical protein
MFSLYSQPILQSDPTALPLPLAVPEVGEWQFAKSWQTVVFGDDLMTEKNVNEYKNIRQYL